LSLQRWDDPTHVHRAVVLELQTRITSRAAQAGLVVDSALAERLAAYLALLAHWNRRINLTALHLDAPSDDAVDRLLVEPLVAARWVESGDRLAIDVGSGGGSPAIPLKLAVPGLRMILVESRVKKAAFLREVVRQLELLDVDVENQRVEDLATRVDQQGRADLVTLRAVTPTIKLWGSIRGLLRAGGRVFWFGGRPEWGALPAAHGAVRQGATETIRTPPNSQLSIFTL
jgi:16S rRNA (guanine527-N7)-methyltransferase